MKNVMLAVTAVLSLVMGGCPPQQTEEQFVEIVMKGPEDKFFAGELIEAFASASVLLPGQGYEWSTTAPPSWGVKVNGSKLLMTPVSGDVTSPMEIWLGVKIAKTTIAGTATVSFCTGPAFGVTAFQEPLTAWKVITICPVGGIIPPPATNLPPVCVNIQKNASCSIAVGIQLGYADPDNDVCTDWEFGQMPQHGILDGTAPSLTYTANPSFEGADSFTFRIRDPGGLWSSWATVTINVTCGTTSVNLAPICANIQISNAKCSVAASILLAYSDPNGDTCTEWELGQMPQHGILDGNAPNMSYTAQAGFSGTDTFTFRIRDNGGLWSSWATVTITVTCTVIPDPDPNPTTVFLTASVVTGSKPLTVVFAANTSHDQGVSITGPFEWDLDGDGTYEKHTGTIPMATHTYVSSGTYNVRVKVKDSTGFTAQNDPPLEITVN